METKPEFESMLNGLHTPEVWGEETLPPNFMFWKSFFLLVWIAPCRIYQKLALQIQRELFIKREKTSLLEEGAQLRDGTDSTLKSQQLS